MDQYTPSNNNNNLVDESAIKIEDIPELKDNPRFVLSNSQELKAAHAPPPVIDAKTVTFDDVMPKTRAKPKKRNHEVEALMEEVQTQELDKAAYQRMKQREDAEIKVKIGYVAQINGYLNEQKFPGVRARANLKKAKYTEDDDIKTLKAAKEALERCIGSSSADDVAKDYFGWLLTGIEMFNRNGVLGIDTTGLSSNTDKIMPSFQKEIDELVIKYQWLFYQPPEFRFITKLVRLLWTLNYMNKHGISKASDADYSAVDPETAERFSDL